MSATEVLERVNRTENPGGRSERGNWLRRHRPDRGADLRGAPDRPDAGSPCRPPYCRPPEQDPGSRRARNIVLIVLGACMALAAVAVAVIKSPAGN
jgi:hypothetical protein